MIDFIATLYRIFVIVVIILIIYVILQIIWENIKKVWYNNIVNNSHKNLALKLVEIEVQNMNWLNINQKSDGVVVLIYSHSFFISCIAVHNNI